MGLLPLGVPAGFCPAEFSGCVRTNGGAIGYGMSGPTFFLWGEVQPGKDGEPSGLSDLEDSETEVGCNTVLPDGSTIGSHVRSVVNSVNNSAQLMVATENEESPSVSNLVSMISQVYSGTNFRTMYGGPGANYKFLGDAGNFAFFAINAKIGVPLLAAELAAGAYSIKVHSRKDWVGPFGMDPSATRVFKPGYGAKCGG